LSSVSLLESSLLLYFLFLISNCFFHSEEDVTKTLFPNPDNQDEVRQASTGTVGETKGKVNNICQAVRKELLDINKNKFLLCILTTYVKNNPPELEEVLLVIKELRDNEAKKTNKVDIIEVATRSEDTGRPVKKVTADEALKYVIFLADVDKLYDVALGMYDFDLAAMVAQKSHKVGKNSILFEEFLPSFLFHHLFPCFFLFLV
jgi:elongator complex protein 1